MIPIIVAACGSQAEVASTSEEPVVSPPAQTVTVYLSDEGRMNESCDAVMAVDWMPTAADSEDLPSASIRRVVRDVSPSAALHRPGTLPLIEYYGGIRVEDGVAIAAFEGGALEYLNAPACAQAAAKAPIEQTLLALPGVTRVEWEIDGMIFTEWGA